MRAVLGHSMGMRITDRYSFEAAEDELLREATPPCSRWGRRGGDYQGWKIFSLQMLRRVIFCDRLISRKESQPWTASLLTSQE